MRCEIINIFMTELFCYLYSFYPILMLLLKNERAYQRMSSAVKNQRVFVDLKRFLVSPSQTGGLPLFLVLGDIFKCCLVEQNK